MKNAIFFFSTFLCFAILSCKSQQSTAGSGPQPTKDSTVYKGVTDQACAVEVAFGSYGSGIDGKGLKKVQELISAKNLASTSKNVGREGETRICLPLTELKGKEKTEFIEQLKKIAKESFLTSVSIR